MCCLALLCHVMKLRGYKFMSHRLRFVLAIWRDETMRLDFLLRDQLQAQSCLKPKLYV